MHDLKFKKEFSDLENQLIQKGLNNVLDERTSTHEEVKKRFENRFKIKRTKTPD